jgi:hypothetical protein
MSELETLDLRALGALMRQIQGDVRASASSWICFPAAVSGTLPPPATAYWERGEWWPAGAPRPWQPEAVRAVSERLVFKPRLAPVA